MSDNQLPTTQKQRAAHREAMCQILKDQGFEQDRWGNWRHPSAPKLRIKFKAVNVRMERKGIDTWTAGNSYVVSQVPLDAWKARVRSYLAIYSKED